MTRNGTWLALGALGVLAGAAALPRGSRAYVPAPAGLVRLEAMLRGASGSRAAKTPGRLTSGELARQFLSLPIAEVPDHLLVALLLAGATKPGSDPVAAALALLARAGGDLRVLAERTDPWAATPQVRDMGQARVKASAELARRAGCRGVAGTVGKILSAADTVNYLWPMVEGPNEILAAVYLDVRNRPLAWRILTRGTDTATVVDPKQVLRPAVEVGASKLVLAHVHPSGDPEPSHEDIAVTARVAAAAGMLGMKLLDHLVLVAGGRYVSLAERGHVPGMSHGGRGSFARRRVWDVEARGVVGGVLHRTIRVLGKDEDEARERADDAITGETLGVLSDSEWNWEEVELEVNSWETLDPDEVPIPRISGSFAKQDRAPPSAVIFRRWKKADGGGIIALFPEHPEARNADLVQSYEHYGQHAAASLSGVVSRTGPVKISDPDVQALKRELEQGFDYYLVIYQRDSPMLRRFREDVLAGRRRVGGIPRISGGTRWTHPSGRRATKQALAAEPRRAPRSRR